MTILYSSIQWDQFLMDQDQSTVDHSSNGSHLWNYFEVLCTLFTGVVCGRAEIWRFYRLSLFLFGDSQPENEASTQYYRPETWRHISSSVADMSLSILFSFKLDKGRTPFVWDKLNWDSLILNWNIHEKHGIIHLILHMVIMGFTEVDNVQRAMQTQPQKHF